MSIKEASKPTSSPFSSSAEVMKYGNGFGLKSSYPDGSFASKFPTLKQQQFVYMIDCVLDFF